MRNRTGSSRKQLFLAMAGVTLAVLLVGALTATLRAQGPAGQSPAFVGDRPAFDVASVKPNKPGGRPYSNVPLAPGDVSPPNGGLFSATNYLLGVYIAFAYDLTVDQQLHLLPQLPKWATTDQFDIEARAQGNPTRDQMRLMMQSLLTDRFKLAVHIETKQSPVYALMLLKTGRTGPQLLPHVDDGSCSTETPAPGAVPPKSATGSAADLLPVCSTGLVWMPPSFPGRVRVGARNVTMGLLADFLLLIGVKGGTGVDRPVFDRTGLSGNLDFAIEFTPESNGQAPPDATGPTFLEALQEQLGLKLVPQTGPVDVLVIDHVEQPSEN